MTTPTTTTEAPPAAAAAAPADPDAPYGRYPSGRRRTEPPKGRRKRAAGAPPRKAATGAPRRTARDYRPGVLGIAQTVCLPLTFAAPADAWAVQAYAPGLAEALNDLAKERPEVAAMLDRLMEAGPYGALIAATVPLLVQLASNHGLIPAAMAGRMGAVPKGEIIAGLQRQAQAAGSTGQDHRQAAAAAYAADQAAAA
jgi:hypothetical protein